MKKTMNCFPSKLVEIKKSRDDPLRISNTVSITIQSEKNSSRKKKKKKKRRRKKRKRRRKRENEDYEIFKEAMDLFLGF